MFFMSLLFWPQGDLFKHLLGLGIIHRVVLPFLSKDQILGGGVELVVT